MRILFIIPPRTRWAFDSVTLSKTIYQEAGTYPTLGPLYVASYLQAASPDYLVRFIDAPAENLCKEALARRILQERPGICGIYLATEYLHDGIGTAALVKTLLPECTVVAGGPHVLTFPGESMRIPHVDYCVYGEGEEAFAALTESLILGKGPGAIPGILHHETTAVPGEPVTVTDLDTLPYPDRTLLNISLYRSFITHSNPITTMMTSRGCSYNCSYCNHIERGRTVRARSADNVVDEMKQIVSLGIRDVFLFDENFTFDIQRVADICDRILTKNITLRWHCRSRADMKLDAHILKMMKRAGCRMIQFGIETGSQRLQRVINKNLDLDKVRDIVRLTRDAGILTYGNFMLGLPGESEEEMKQTIRYATDLGLDYAPFSLFYPLPRSVFYEQALKNGVITDDYWLDYVRDPAQEIRQYSWIEHDQESLTRMNYRAFREFYLRPGTLLRALFRKQSFAQKIWQFKSGLKVLLPKK